MHGLVGKFIIRKKETVRASVIKTFLNSETCDLWYSYIVRYIQDARDDYVDTRQIYRILKELESNNAIEFMGKHDLDISDVNAFGRESSRTVHVKIYHGYPEKLVGYL